MNFWIIFLPHFWLEIRILCTGLVFSWISGLFLLHFWFKNRILSTGLVFSWISGSFCLTFDLRQLWILSIGLVFAWISGVFCLTFDLKKEFLVQAHYLQIVCRKSIASLRRLTQDVQQANLRRTAGDPTWVYGFLERRIFPYRYVCNSIITYKDPDHIAH